MSAKGSFAGASAFRPRRSRWPSIAAPWVLLVQFLQVRSSAPGNASKLPDHKAAAAAQKGDERLHVFDGEGISGIPRTARPRPFATLAFVADLEVERPQ